MIFYTWSNGYGRAMADDLAAEDLFDLAPGEIVGRIVAAGYTPWIEAPQPDMLPTLGKEYSDLWAGLEGPSSSYKGHERRYGAESDGTGPHRRAR